MPARSSLLSVRPVSMRSVTVLEMAMSSSVELGLSAWRNSSDSSCEKKGDTDQTLEQFLLNV